jgi:TolB protein
MLFAVLLMSLSGCNEETLIEPIQIGSIAGRVKYNTDGKSAGHVLIRLSPTGRMAETDSLGWFQFDQVSAGKYTIEASKTGYREEFTVIEATPNVRTEVTIMLAEGPNKPPSVPTLVSPDSGNVWQKSSVTLKWKATDPENDLLTYEINVLRSGVLSQKFTGIKADSLVLNGLSYGTAYSWQVIVRDGSNTVNGAVWSFNTHVFPSFSYVYVRRIENRYQLFTSNETGESVQLTNTGNNWRPIFSPNRLQIAFLSNAETDVHLYLMNRDGSNLRRVTSVPVRGLMPLDLSFCWSPDGTELLYPGNDKLYAVRSDGTGLRPVYQAPAGRFFAGCAWNPATKRIAVRTTSTGSVYDNRLMLMSPEGKDTTTIFSTKTNRMSNPVFSVDGLKLLYSLDKSGFQDEQGRQLDARIYLLDTKTKGVADLSAVTGKVAGTNDLEPRFSPTGAKIVFTSTDNTGTGECQVMVIDTVGKSRTVLIGKAEMLYWR